jgi:ubiquitin-conjugating enzyme E2 Z
MHGSFNYKSLDWRLRKIRAAIDAETEHWIQEGKKAYAAGDTAAENLQFQFSQCQQGVSSSGGSSTVTFEMERDNPFLWTLVTPPPCTYLPFGLIGGR